MATKLPKITKSAVLATSRYGSEEPTVMVHAPKGTSYRIMSAILHRLAADIELELDAAGERWAVKVECYSGENGYVALELSKDGEGERAMATLRSVIKGSK